MQTSAPPGTPGAPTDKTKMVSAMEKTNDIVIGTPNIFAIKSAEIIWVIQLPSILIVAPSGIEKEYTFFAIPSRSLHISIETGIVALLDAIVKAESIAGENFLKNVTGFNRPKISKINP